MKGGFDLPAAELKVGNFRPSEDIGWQGTMGIGVLQLEAAGMSPHRVWMFSF